MRRAMRTRRRLVIASVLCLVFSSVIFLNWSRGTRHDIPIEQQKRFVYEVFFPLMDEAVLSYPVESLRARFAQTDERIKSGEIALAMSLVFPDVKALGGARTNEHGQPELIIWVQVVMELWQDIDGDRELFKDQIIGVILHEEYHLDHHQGDGSDDESPEIAVQQESEAWWYSIEQVYLPQINAGRLHHVDVSIRDGIRAYRAAKGDPYSVAWQEFAEEATGRPHRRTP